MKALIDSCVSWVAYPLIMVSGVLLHNLLIGTDIPPAGATYLPIMLAALTILTLERTHPYRVQWQPDAKEVRTDLTFMALVQIFWPQVLAAMLAFAIIDPIHALNLPLPQLWPQELPVLVQAIIMLVLADLLRYWLHRFAHKNPTLWQFHAVHHSPDRLYGLNVGRFHPFEKALQMLLDPLPFLLLGVNAPVLAMYYVMYATNGFFQHCNVRLNYGWLNYVVGSAQTHRWHHARDQADGTHNFGNTVIVWDLVFGTWYLPKDRDVGPLGIANTEYPQSFSDQLRTPFTPNITARPVPVWSWVRITSHIGLRIRMKFAHLRYAFRKQVETRFPRWAQQRALQRIIQRNRDSSFGRRHHFASMITVADYQKSVAVAQYEDLRRAIEKQAIDGNPELTIDRPTLYARTSGTTGLPKYLPVIPQAIDQYRREQERFISEQYQACPAAFSGSLFVLTGAAIEGEWHKHPVGSISGVLTEALPSFVQKSLVIPDAVFSIPQPELKLLLILRLALAKRDLTYLGSPNPSTFLRLLELLRIHWTALTESIETGVFTGWSELPEPVRSRVQHALGADPARADELRRITTDGPITYASLWPSIGMITTWSGGSCGIALEALRTTLPKNVVVFELGYLASELRGTFSQPGGQSGLPTIRDNFFEFIRCEDQEQGSTHYLTLEQLQCGERYYVIVTTPNGLYRYFMDDIVEVTGFCHNTPLLRFMQKGKGVCNMTGEKLYEAHVIEAMQNISGILPLFYVLVADEAALRYDLFVECAETPTISFLDLAERLDRQLCRLNIEYAAKRTSGRLNPPRAMQVAPGTGEQFKAHSTRTISGGAQYKPRIVHYRKQLQFKFYDCTTASGDNATSEQHQ